MFKLVPIFALLTFSLFVHADTDRELVAIITWNYPTSTPQTTSENLAAQTKLRDMLTGTTFTGSTSSTRSIGTIYFPGYTLSNGYFYIEGYWSFNKLFPSGRDYTGNLDTVFYLGADTYYVQGAPLAVRDYSLSGSSWWKTTNIKIGNTPQSFTFQIGAREFGYDWSTEEGVYYGASCWGTAYIWRLKNAVSLDYTTPSAGNGWSTPSLPSGSTGQPQLGENNPTGVPDVPSSGEGGEGGEGTDPENPGTGGGGTTDPDDPGTGGGGTGGGGTGGGGSGGGSTGGTTNITGNITGTITGTVNDGNINITVDNEVNVDIPPPVTVPEPPDVDDIKVDDPLQKIAEKLKPDINLPSGGSFDYPRFTIPLPKREGIVISIGDGLENTSISRAVRTIQTLTHAIGYFLITLVTFKAIIKLFRKNS